MTSLDWAAVIGSVNVVVVRYSSTQINDRWASFIFSEVEYSARPKKIGKYSNRPTIQVYIYIYIWHDIKLSVI